MALVPSLARLLARKQFSGILQTQVLIRQQSTTDLSTNPLLCSDPYTSLPPFQDIKSAHVVPAIDHLVSTHAADVSALETWLQDRVSRGSGSLTFEDVVGLLERIDASKSYQSPYVAPFSCR